MSVDRSLKLKGSLVRHRNVLTRGERVEHLKEEERWEEGNSIFGLPKVAHRKVSVKKKAEAKAAEGVPAGTEGAVAAAPGAAGAPAAGKAAAPAAKAAPAGKAAPAKAAPAAKSTGQGKPGGGGGRR